MSLVCRWTKPALEDIDRIEEYIAQDNPKASIDTVIKIVQTIETNLTARPNLGRAGQIYGTREFVIPGTPYIAAYRVQDQCVQVLRILHGAQKWPETLDRQTP